MKACWLTVAAVLLLAGAAGAQAPTRIDQIPVYPGATRDRDAEQTDEAQRLYMVGEYDRAYVAAASIEEVVRFYRQRLAAQEVRSDADWERTEQVREQLRPGAVSPVRLETGLRDFNDMEAWSHEFPVVTPERLRQAFTQKRPPYRPGEWVHEATLSWIQKVGDHDQSFSVWLLDWNEKKIFEEGYRPETFIRFTRGETAAEQTEFERLSSEAAREEEPRKAPAEEGPGVATYPGARFDPAMSENLGSGGDARHFVYTTADDLATVRSFYERQTGKKAEAFGEGAWIVVLRGAAP